MKCKKCGNEMEMKRSFNVPSQSWYDFWRCEKCYNELLRKKEPNIEKITIPGEIFNNGVAKIRLEFIHDIMNENLTLKIKLETVESISFEGLEDALDKENLIKRMIYSSLKQGLNYYKESIK
jgi:hypothetical protein